MRNLLYARHRTTFHGILIPSTTFCSSSPVSSKDAFVTVHTAYPRPIKLWSITDRSFTKCGESSVHDLTTSFVRCRVGSRQWSEQMVGTLILYKIEVILEWKWIQNPVRRQNGFRMDSEWSWNGAGMESGLRIEPEWSQGCKWSQNGKWSRNGVDNNICITCTKFTKLFYKYVHPSKCSTRILNNIPWLGLTNFWIPCDTKNSL